MKLDQFMKWNGWVGTGGEAKFLIQTGRVRVNGDVETRRGRQLIPGDQVEYEGNPATVPDNGPSTA